MKGRLIVIVIVVAGFFAFLALKGLKPETAPASSFSYDFSFYRFDDNLQNAEVIEGAPEAPDAPSLQLSFDKDSASKWSSESQKSRLSATGRSVLFRSNGPDTLVSPEGLGIDGNATTSVILRMSVSGPPLVEMMWSPPNAKKLWDKQKVRIHIPRQNEMVNYNLNTAAIQAWHLPEIDQLRFIVGSPATIEIESIKAVSAFSEFADSTAGKLNYCVGDDCRPALYNRCPGRIRYSVKVPPNAAFSADLAVARPDAPVTFKLTATDGRQTQTLLSTRVSDPRSWQTSEADLSAFSGRDILLSLVTECETPGQVAIWANSLMFQRLSPSSDQARRPPNVLLYVVDCMRADHLNCYGYPRETMPFVASLANQGVKFEHCYAQDTWTKSSMTSLATGVDQLVHGVEQYGDLVPSTLVMLPELLRKHGYDTCAISENPHTPPETVRFGNYSRVEPVYLEIKGTIQEIASQKPLKTYETAAGFLQQNRHKPFFLYIHTMEAHDVNCPERPCDVLLYETPEPYKSLFEAPGGQQPMDVYDGALAFADANFERLFDKLGELGVADDTVIILTADHGEAFAEHENYNGHAWKAYNTLIHVPLVIRYPRVFDTGKTVTTNVQLIDLAPTILHLLGLPAQQQFQGKSLIPLSKGYTNDFEQRFIFSKWFGSTSMIQNQWKLMFDYSLNKGRLFNLHDDPVELNDLSNGNFRVHQYLRANLHDHVEKQKNLNAELTRDRDDSAVGIDPRVQEQLEALGYLDDDNNKTKHN